MDILELYDIADNNNIDVYNYPLKIMKSISTPNAIGMDMEQINSTVDEKVILAHELGHCITGSFYNIYSKYDIKERHEKKAENWSIKTLIPLDVLKEVLKKGITTPWELSEYFDVPETFIKKMLDLYKDELLLFNEESEQYFY